MIYNQELRNKLMHRYGLTAQQIDSKAVEALINVMAEAPGGANVLNELCQEIRARLEKMAAVEEQTIGDLRAAKQEIAGWYDRYKADIDKVKGKCEKNLDELKTKTLALEAAVSEYGEITDEKALNAIRLYTALLNIGKTAGDRDMALKNAGYAVYAYLGGQARNVVVPDGIKRDGSPAAIKPHYVGDGEEWGEWQR